jgi:transposase
MYLVRLRTSVKNRLHGLVGRQEEKYRKDMPAGRDLFGKLGMNWLNNLELPEPEASMLKNMLSLLDGLTELIKESNQWIKTMFESDPICQRLKTIPGIGMFLAVLIRFEIDTIDRFSSVSKLHSFAGMVPTTHSSGGKTYHGKLIKSCNHWLKWGLIESVWPAITHDPWLRKIYYGKKKHKHTNVAKSIVAKKILSLVYKVWKEERNYIPIDPSLITGQP